MARCESANVTAHFLKVFNGKETNLRWVSREVADGRAWSGNLKRMGAAGRGRAP